MKPPPVVSPGQTEQSADQPAQPVYPRRCRYRKSNRTDCGTAAAAIALITRVAVASQIDKAAAALLDRANQQNFPAPNRRW